MENTEEALLLRTKKTKALGLLMVSLAFVVGGLWMALEGETFGYYAVAFFGLGVIVGGLLLHPDCSYLRIEAEGFTYCSLFRSHFTAWSDVQEFGILSIAGNDMVGFNYVPSYQASRFGRKLSSAIADCQAALPDTYGMKVDDLVDLLNKCLMEASTNEDDPKQ